MIVALGIYVAGFVLIQIGASWSMRTEPTTHGQDVLFGFGIILGLIWPIALVYLAIVLPIIGVGALVHFLREYRR